VGSISTELSRINYDLLVIGAPSPRYSPRLYFPDITYRLIEITPVPVLIIPMSSR
jgi:hypothetical protein